MPNSQSSSAQVAFFNAVIAFCKAIGTACDSKLYQVPEELFALAAMRAAVIHRMAKRLLKAQNGLSSTANAKRTSSQALGRPKMVTATPRQMDILQSHPICSLGLENSNESHQSLRPRLSTPNVAAQSALHLPQWLQKPFLGPVLKIPKQ